VRNPLPPVPLTLAFVDYINHGDLPRLVSLMSADHRLRVLDEESPHGVVAVLGHTTGFHLGLADGEESRLTLIWVAECYRGAISGWTLVEDTPFNRERYGLGVQEK
jgi:hypothetical protein